MSTKFKVALGSTIAALSLVAGSVFAGYAPTAAFTRSLTTGSTGSDVKMLQEMLNACADTALAVTAGSAGSAGYESMYFGNATKAAVAKYQTKYNISPAVGYFGPMTRANVAAKGNECGTTTTTLPPGCVSTSGFSPITGQPCSGGSTTQTGPVTASLAATNPAPSVLVAGQATANLAQFTFTGSGAVTQVTLQRIGVSADSTLSNVYLFDGATRLTDASSVSNNGAITFNVPAGIFTVAGSKTITVKSDIAGSTNGQTVGVTLVSFMSMGATTATTANLSGNTHSIATATLATVSAGTVTPSGATLNPGSGVTVWQSTLNISQRDVWAKRLAFRQVGSAPSNSMVNFKLYVNGVQAGSSAGIDALGYVTFDLSSSPVLLASGSRIVRVDADIVSGASRTVQFSLRQAADADFVDSSYGVNITPTSTPWAPSSASTIGGVSGGTMTIEKDTSSPTQNITLNGNNVKLATFKVTAYGEAIKLETLRASYASSDASVSSLRNGLIKINGVQYGSTATLLEDSNGVGYTSYTTNYVVMPGTPVMIDIFADVYDNDGTDNLSAADTITAKLVTGSSNAMRQDSLGSFNAPGADVSGNTLTVATASVSLVINPTYANPQTVVVPQTSSYKLGSWNLAGSSVEDVLLTTLSFDVDEVTNLTFSEADLTNLTAVVKDTNGNTLAAPSPLGTVSAADNNFSINYTLMKNTSVVIELWSTIGSSITAADSLKTDLSVTGTSLVGGQSVTASDVDGQTIIAGTGSITVSADATTPVAAILADNQTVDTAVFKFAALYSGYNVTDITLTVANATNVANVMLYDGATLVASKPGSATVTFNGLNWNVPSNSNKYLTVKLQLGAVGIGAGTSGASILTTLTSATATSTGTGVSAAVTESPANPAGNAMYVYAAIPTITNVTLPTSVLSTGTVTASKFTINTNGSGTIGWKKLIFTVTRAMGGTDTLATPTLWDADTNTQIAGTATFTGSIEVDNDVAGGIEFVATNEQQISGAKTYVLKVVTAGTFVSGDNLNVSIAQPSSFAAPAAYATVAATTSTFTWTDVSAASHDETTLDWNNGFLVKNLPTDSQTLSKN